MKKIFLILVFVLFLTYPLFAETIVLKSGKTIEGKIIEKTDKNIKIDFYGVTLTYSLDEIQSIGTQNIEQKMLAPVGAVSGKIDKNSLKERIKQAAKSKKRMQTKTQGEMDYQFMFLEHESFSDIDPEQKIMYSTSKLKDFKFKMSEMFKGKIQKEISQARAKGVPEEKLKEMEESGRQFDVVMTGMMSQMFEQMKNMKLDSYIVADTLYMGINDKWFKMTSPMANSIWQVYQSLKEGFDKESLSKASEGLPEQFRDMLSGLEGFDQDYGDIANFKEDNFNGTPCYRVEYDSGKFFDKMKEMLVSYGEKTDGRKINPDQMDLKSLSVVLFISKQNFLSLGADIDLKARIVDPNLEEPMSMVVTEKTQYNYPSGHIQLPAVLSQAKQIENEEELKNILMKDMFKEPSGGI